MARKTRVPQAVRLEFGAGTLVQSNLSGVAFAGPDWLWVAGDEACGVERLQRLSPLSDGKLRFGAARDFALADLLDLPGDAAEEADLEGLAVAEGCLWLVGSHGYKRKGVKPERSDVDNAKRLAKLSLDANRRLLACIPMETDAEGRPMLVRQDSQGRRAARLPGDAKGNVLTQLLNDDPHFGPFMKIPGKDNGFDIEGIAVDGDRLLLGLRGPVLRGWSGLLEIRVQRKGNQLRLQPLDASGLLIRKHFLQLHGLGVRDLHFSGDDLFVLAGPTMVLNGEIRLFRWNGARAALAANTEAVRFVTELHSSEALPHGQGCDRAEAICALPSQLDGGHASWLVLYDAPGPERREGEATVFGDLLVRSGS